MTRPRITQGSVEHWQALMRELVAHLSGPAQEMGVWEKAIPHLGALNNAQSELQALADLGLCDPNKEPVQREPDQSSFTELSEQWRNLVMSDLATWGSSGFGAVTSIGEAVALVHALAIPWAAGTTDFRIYYRGEHQYGWKLQSRAERRMGEPPEEDGLSDRELEEIGRFQEQVLADSELAFEIFQGSAPPELTSPEWLAAMQHYDEPFGTRMLDLTSSVFAGLHFATIGWDGEVADVDGLLYVFMGARSWRRFAPPRVGEPDWLFNDDITETVPLVLSSMFAGWRYPEIPRLFMFPPRNPRLVAQDGLFLVPGTLGGGFDHGQHFRIRIPAHAKGRIARELWIAGYTPERIVRGERGREARERVERYLQSR